MRVALSVPVFIGGGIVWMFSAVRFDSPLWITHAKSRGLLPGGAIAQ